MPTHHAYATLLRSAGFRATPGKIKIIQGLESLQKPASVSDLSRQLHGKLNTVTLYRSLEDMVNTGIVQRVDLGHAHAHYELIKTGKHHHHVICRMCGAIEDVALCGASKLEAKVLSESKRFVSIETHTMEFFGICKACIKK